MLLPFISCSVHIKGQSSKQRLCIDANVNGFEVDIDGTLVDYLNKLSVIYLASVDRVNAFAAEANFGVVQMTLLLFLPLTNPLVHMEILPF